MKDWTSLAQSERAAATAACRQRTATLGTRLNAVAAMLPETTTANGPLAGLPYVAKDLFATGLHTPSNGLASSTASDARRGLKFCFASIAPART